MTVSFFLPGRTVPDQAQGFQGIGAHQFVVVFDHSTAQGRMAFGCRILPSERAAPARTR
jgi:hypothetical protein